MSLSKYLITVLKINYLVLGGASLTAPFYYQYYTQKGIIGEEQITNYLAMANILPGAMSIYMTAYTGLHLHGKKGMYLGLSILFIPIILVSILIFEIIRYFPFNLEYLIYISLPIIIVAAIDYLKIVFSSKTSLKLKIITFFLTLFCLLTNIITTIGIIITFVAIMLFFTVKEQRV